MVKNYMYKSIISCKRQGYTKTEIGKKLGLDPATVRKYYNMTEKEYRTYLDSVSNRQKVFDSYEKEILDVYRQNGNKKLSVSAVFDYLEERYPNLPGTEKTLRNYIGHLTEKNELKFVPANRVYIKVPELPLGKQLQIDFGEYMLLSGLKVYIFAAVLSASRYKYIGVQERPFTTLDMIGHLLDCFDYIGGIPEQIVIDQDSVMVVTENYGDIIYTQAFKYFKDEMGIEVYVCRKADPESKGKIENLVKFVKSNFLSVRDFGSIKEVREGVLGWLKRRANGKISQATKKIPADIIEEERKHLRKVRNSIYRKESLVDRESRIVDERCRISVSSSLYSVPSSYKNKEVEIFKTETRLFIFDKHEGHEIADHKLSLVDGAVVINKAHGREKQKKLKEMKEEVLAQFPLENWKEFVCWTFKTHPRYVRDQCVEAGRRFTGNEDLQWLEKALAFCLENETYTMKNLLDTYSYYLNLSKNPEEDILGKMTESLKQAARFRNKVRVEKRSIGVYKSLVTIIAGVFV